MAGADILSRYLTFDPFSSPLSRQRQTAPPLFEKTPRARRGSRLMGRWLCIYAPEHPTSRPLLCSPISPYPPLVPVIRPRSETFANMADTTPSNGNTVTGTANATATGSSDLYSVASGHSPAADGLVLKYANFHRCRCCCHLFTYLLVCGGRDRGGRNAIESKLNLQRQDQPSPPYLLGCGL
jgi:hypothetical protein